MNDILCEFISGESANDDSEILNDIVSTFKKTMPVNYNNNEIQEESDSELEASLTDSEESVGIESMQITRE